VDAVFRPQKNWRRVVIVSPDPARPFDEVRNSLEAADLLIHGWPIRSGKAFTLALKACVDALDGNASDEDARTNFLAAAREAEVAITVH
jgi:hypothetical protein